MNAITFKEGQITVEADIVAKGLLLTPEALREGFRDGSVTSQCEKGLGTDAGRYRLTFYAPSRRMRLTVDAAGIVLHSSSTAYARKPRTGLPHV